MSIPIHPTTTPPPPTRGFSLVEEALLVFEAQDPNEERYVKLAAAVQNAI